MTRESESTNDTQNQGASSLPVPQGFGQLALPRANEEAVTEKTGAQPRADQPESAEASSRAAFSTHVHQYIREYIQLADQKAMFFFAGSTALLAFLFKAGISNRWLKAVMLWNVLDLTSFIAMVALGVSALVALWVITPRSSGSRRGHVFWEAIAEFQSSRDYADDVARLTTPTLAQLHAEHCYELAQVCRAKYRVLKAALWIGGVGLCATIIVLLFVRVAIPTS